MTPAEIQKELVMIIKDIQQASGLECPALDGGVVPANEVPKFDSKIWIAATANLEVAIGVDLPKKLNIFIDANTKEPLALGQIVELVCSQLSSIKAAEEAA